MQEKIYSSKKNGMLAMTLTLLLYLVGIAAMIVGIVEGLFVDNGAPAPSYTEQQNTYPVYKIDALLDWLLVGKPEENIQSALDTFLLIDYYGFHIQDNFMSLLNDVARLLINLLPSLGLFSSSAHLAYEPDELTVSWYVDDKLNGKIDGENCYGEQKIIEFSKMFDIRKMDAFYSDSLSDLPIMKKAKKAYLVDGDKITEIDAKKYN